MAAQDHLSPAQFLTLYHGTTDERADSIAATGFRRNYAGYPMRGRAADTWGTMSTDRDSAGSYVRTVERGQRVPTQGHGSVVEFRIPAEHAAEYVNPVEPKYEPGVYAVRRDIPPEYVHQVHRNEADREAGS